MLPLCNTTSRLQLIAYGRKSSTLLDGLHNYLAPLPDMTILIVWNMIAISKSKFMFFT